MAKSKEISRAYGRLIEAHDQECMRIARELHDDIGSSLGTLGIELVRLGQPVDGSSGEKHPGIPELYQSLQEIGSRISRLSHQLNPPMLKYFGLAKAIESDCQACAKEFQIPVSFSCRNIPRLDFMVELNLLRVVQEALRNAGKYSRATGVAVNVSATSAELTLEVSDDGVGFDTKQTQCSNGLGLIRMQARMRLAGGDIEIRSAPGKGVKISCRVPMP
jgi:two-component system, NarL family, sensor kinase